MTDIFDDALEITEESVEAQVEAASDHQITTPELIRLLRCGGADDLNQRLAGEEIERLRRVEAFVLRISAESNGVVGYHLNGDVAAWEEFEEFAEIEDARRALEGDTK